MTIPKQYNPQEAEPRWMERWQQAGIYHFLPDAQGPIYSIDTPPPTVSGNLHLGHVYSYSHPDFIARFWRMRGHRVYYPMGYDDNGLPTERLVERRHGVTAAKVGRAAFILKCLEVSEQAERDYEALWKRLGLSVDWRYTYRTIDDASRHICQLSFIELYRKGLAYRREAPALWCPECHTAIAQAELNDLDAQSEFVTLPFRLVGDAGGLIPIATTRPELLPACVAVFIHPTDARFQGLEGSQVVVPFFGQVVPVLADPGADPQKGTGAVMCCTFGDIADVSWWRTHHLPLIEAIDRDGRMTSAAGDFHGLSIEEARRQVKERLAEQGLVLSREAVTHSLRVHERCDTPVEYIVTNQWFIRVLDHKETFLRSGEKVRWHPESMHARYRAWVENLNWDWCISRQRYHGVPFPVWYCASCGETILADVDQLPVDPYEEQPSHPCSCGSTSFIPDGDIFDTWATSSMSPQIVGGWLDRDKPGSLYEKVFPFSLRPQAHEIIRTWAFYTIVKSYDHFGVLPWSDTLISGWGIAGEGMGKISKSRGGGPMPPMEMIQRYSADAVRYWASSTAPGKDSMISEEKIQMGAKLITKLWNVARFSERFVTGGSPSPLIYKAKESVSDPTSHSLNPLSPADRWILSRLQRLIRRVTAELEGYDYAAAKSEIESFFWRDLADNYLEMSKQRLYDPQSPQHGEARYALHAVMYSLLKLLAPFLPFVTEEIFQGLWGAGSSGEGFSSIHLATWPEPDPSLEDDQADTIGEKLVEIATAVRRYKSEHNLPLGSELDRLQLAAKDAHLADALRAASEDLCSITRAKRVVIVDRLDPRLEELKCGEGIDIALARVISVSS
jgi:valyl-tRNA synthetase